MKKRGLLTGIFFTVLLLLGSDLASADPVSTFSGSISVNENASLDFSLLSLVSSSDPLASISINFGPLNGSLLPGAVLGDFIYTPKPDYFGSDVFHFLATDSMGDVSNESIVSITVREVNLPPNAAPGTFETLVNTPLEIALSTLVSSTNEVPIVSYSVGIPLDGTIPSFDPTTGILFYVPNTGFGGLDQFDYAAKAANGLQSENVINVAVGTTPPAVPEPSSILLLGTGLIGGIGAMRRRFPK